jgi:hypothetical protein
VTAGKDTIEVQDRVTVVVIGAAIADVVDVADAGAGVAEEAAAVTLGDIQEADEICHLRNTHHRRVASATHAATITVGRRAIAARGLRHRVQ